MKASLLDFNLLHIFLSYKQMFVSEMLPFNIFALTSLDLSMGVFPGWFLGDFYEFQL